MILQVGCLPQDVWLKDEVSGVPQVGGPFSWDDIFSGHLLSGGKRNFGDQKFRCFPKPRCFEEKKRRSESHGLRILVETPRNFTFFANSWKFKG